MKTPSLLLASLAALLLLPLPPRLAAQSALTFTTLYSFVLSSDRSNNVGVYPAGPLAEGSDGNFYGTAKGGGGAGTVFKVTPAGDVTLVLDDANTVAPDPNSGLILGVDGNFYGAGDYSLFKVTPAGVPTDLHAFGGNYSGAVINHDGLDPLGPLSMDASGTIYGVTAGGGSKGYGTAYSLTQAGVLTVIYNFGAQGNTKGYSHLTVTLGSDGNLYGTNEFGGSAKNPDGLIYKLTMAGEYSVLHYFSGGADGEMPEAPLIEGSDGNFYGTAVGGGENGGGTVFEITPAGVLSVLHSFTSDGTEGYAPTTPLILAKDGDFYGGTSQGGGSDGAGGGTLYRLSATGGDFAVLASFPAGSNDYLYPSPWLIQARDGNFYGATAQGGSNGEGSIFVLGTGAPILVGPSTATATRHGAFSYQITATNDPTNYATQGLLAGLSLNHATGLITGKPNVAPGTYNITLKAANAKGEDTQMLSVTILGPPVIDSSLTASARVGRPFSYSITATNRPTNFGGINLPPGLHLDHATGLISGIIDGMAGTYHFTIKAANAAGTASQMLTLTVSEQ